MIRDVLRPQALPVARVAACLGLVSDSHAPERCTALPEALFHVLEGVDLILHAGDVGELSVLDRLSALAPVIAVQGNDDSEDAHRELPLQQVITAAGCRILLYHSHFPDPAEESAWRRRKDKRRGDSLELRSAAGGRAKARIVVYGHTHVPLVAPYEGVLLVNPGALAPPNPITRQAIRTVALLYVLDDGEPFVVHVDLAAPDRQFSPAWWREHDWEDGVGTVADRFQESIVDPAFAADAICIWEGLQAADPDLRSGYSVAVLGEARRCWAGELSRITRAGLVCRIETDPTIPDPLRPELVSLLEGSSDWSG